MATILESLKSISGYPIPLRTLTEKAERRGLNLDDEATVDVLTESAYLLATADLMVWLSTAPNISQGGQSFSFSEDQQKLFRQRAHAIYAAYGDPSDVTQKPVYGYIGSRF